MDNLILALITISLVVYFRSKNNDKKINDYNKYLQSRHWKRTREKVLKRYGYKCMICGRTDNLQVHHNSYKNLGHEHKNDLVPLCSYHHKMIHNKLKKIEKVV